jgi:hypothetical protein
MNLFDKEGHIVHKTLPFEGAMVPGIIVWQGRYFRLDAGRYIESTVHHA